MVCEHLKTRSFSSDSQPFLSFSLLGLDVVDKIEQVGSGSGRTAKPVVVKDCGEL